MIDIDKIQKLIKLANNNPNDNEANSAARMVCKLLANYEFKQVANQQQPFVNGFTEITLAELFRQQQGFQQWTSPFANQSLKRCKNCNFANNPLNQYCIMCNKIL